MELGRGMVGAGGCWWVLVGAGECWWELVGAGECWWDLPSAPELTPLTLLHSSFLKQQLPLLLSINLLYEI